MKSNTMDLTQGNIAKEIVLFSLPILVGQIFQNLYNSVDAIIVGNFVGTTALAAVSSCSDISMLLIGFFTGLSTGSGVLFARYFGAKDKERLHTAIHTAISFVSILGIVMTVAGILLTPLLLKMVDCPSDVWMESAQYLRVYLIGILFTSLYNVGAGILRAVGDSRTPLYFLIATSLINMALDILFVAFFSMGVIGAAAATVISQLASVLLVLFKLMRTNDIYRVSLKGLKIDKATLLQVMDLGFPAAIQASLISISNLFVQRYINSFGSSAMAGIGAAKKIDRFAGMAAQSIGLAMSTFVGQNCGAKREDRAFQGIRSAMVINLFLVAALGIPIYFFAEDFLRIFTSNEEALYYGVEMVHIMMPFYYFQSLNQIFSNSVRGFGKSRVVMLCSVLGMIGCRQIFLAISMNLQWKVQNVYIGFPVGWACAAAAVILYYLFAIRLPYNRQAVRKQAPEN